jgi:GAF domain
VTAEIEDVVRVTGWRLEPYGIEVVVDEDYSDDEVEAILGVPTARVWHAAGSRRPGAHEGAARAGPRRGPLRVAHGRERMRSVVEREELRVRAEEQAALRRVATLVARGVPPDEVFAAVTEEAGKLLSAEYAGLGRYESDGTMTIVAGSGRRGDEVPVGRRWSLGGKNINTRVFETGRPARIDDYADASGPLGDTAREYEIGSAVGTPVIVEGRLWGVMAIYSTPD